MWGERRCRLDLYLLEVAPYANAADIPRHDFVKVKTVTSRHTEGGVVGGQIGYEHETSRRRIDVSDCEGGPTPLE